MPPFTFTITEADYVQAMQLHYRPHRWARAAQVAAGALVGVAVLISAWVATQGDTLTLIYSGTVAVGLAALLYVYKVYLAATARRTFHQHKALHQPVTVELEADTSTWSNENSHSTHPWADMHRWKEDDASFLLYHTPSLFQFLPKRAMPSPAAVETLRGYLTQHQVPSADATTAQEVIRTLLWIVGPLLVLFSALIALARHL